MAVLEGAGEEDARPGLFLQVGSLGTEADDHRPRVEAAEGLQQQVDAFLAAELPDVEDRGGFAGQEIGKALRVVLVGRALVARRRRVRRVETGLGDQACQGLLARLGQQFIDVHPGRHHPHPLLVGPRPDHLAEHPAHVLGAGDDGSGRSERRARPRAEGGIAAHGVLEL